VFWREKEEKRESVEFFFFNFDFDFFHFLQKDERKISKAVPPERRFPRSLFN
jgi:hypothetical protein